MTHYLIAHGTYGNPEGNWYSWLKNQLSPASVVIPKFPTPEGQSLEIWERIAMEAIRESKPESTILIGHSIGAALILRLAERTETPYRGLVAVCPFMQPLGLPDFDVLNSSFISRDPNWSAIRSGTRSVICMAGDNDPYVPLAYSEKIATALHTDLITIPNGGHLNAASGMLQFPLLFEKLKLLD